MKAEDSLLFRLIRSLEKNEKGYFRKQAGQYGKERSQNYLKLFDAIDKQATYDETALKKQFAGLGTSGFSQAKAYLLENILKSLIQYYQGNSVADKAQHLMDAGVVLFNKNLEQEAGQYFTKAKALAYKIEDHRLALNVLKWEKLILGLHLSDSFPQEIEKLLMEEQLCTENISMMAELQKAYYAAFYMIKKERNLSNEQQREELERIMQAPVLKGERYKCLIQGRITYHNIHLFYYDLTGEYEKGLEHARLILEAWQENEVLQHENLGKYLAAIQNYMNECWRLSRYEAILPLLEDMRLLRPGNAQMRTRVFEAYHQCEIMYYATSLKLEEYLPKIDAFLEELDGLKHQVRPNYHWLFMYNLSGFCLFTGNFEKALMLVNRLLPGNEDYDLLKDTKRVILIINLIIHYELGNMEALPYYVRSTERALKLQECGELDMSFIRFMKKLCSIPLSERKDLFAEYLNQTQTLEAQTDGLGSITKIFDWKLWLTSQITKRPMIDVWRDQEQAPAN